MGSGNWVGVTAQYVPLVYRKIAHFLLSTMHVHRYCVKTFTGHSEWVRQVKVSPDGEYAFVSFMITMSYMLILHFCI